MKSSIKCVFHLLPRLDGEWVWKFAEQSLSSLIDRCEMIEQIYCETKRSSSVPQPSMLLDETGKLRPWWCKERWSPCRLLGLYLYCIFPSDYLFKVWWIILIYFKYSRVSWRKAWISLAQQGPQWASGQLKDICKVKLNLFIEKVKLTVKW